ncbi:MAG: hypothetical protein DIZ80_13075 [endosymbiont of Galathealinum brachiosum]|uniref:Phosphoglycerate mutase n=1 Tax=endosymbiont of Galathealinum brachiosum TaxID=2200906 RepID=A0A370D7X9_9GAMM|nr:MAG: hypothetical protein DIZ80_13075 [endosymbiont of Galathealinum brachiosum]
MKQLNMVIPGLLGPFANDMPAHIQQQLNKSDFKLVNKILSRSDMYSDQSGSKKNSSYYETLVQLINPECKQSLCQLTAEYDGVDISEGYFYRADPVHYKAESDHAILIGTELVLPESEEVEKLITCFNQHFAEDDLSLHSTHEHRWYLKSNKPLKLEFNALDYALGRDIKHFMPQGEDEIWWRKIVNEAQMLFFSHEVNQGREAKGEMTINGLWLWDLRFDSDCTGTQIPRQLFADEVLAIALAKQAGVSVLATEEIDSVDSNSVLVLDQLYESVCYGDVDVWLEDLKIFCEDKLKQVIDLLASKKVDEVNIYPCNGQIFKINRMNLLKFWKKNKPLYKYMSSL